MTDRIVVLLDMDCFYVQVEERDHPYIKGKPAAVVQYNTWKGGGLIATNYEARAAGVKKGNMRGADAKACCPDIQLIQVPVNRGKADLTKYRLAGKEVMNVLIEFSECVERASIDEAYIDFTEAVERRINALAGKPITSDLLKGSWVVGFDQEEGEVGRKNGLQEWLHKLYNSNPECEAVDSSSFTNLTNHTVYASHPNRDKLRLTVAALLCEEMRAEVLARTGFKCSAGISHNKMLGKLACGLHKPNQQTVLPMENVPELWAKLPVQKIRHLGGKLGESLVDELGCKTMGDLSQFSLTQLRGRYDDKTALWLYGLGRGICPERVTARQLPKSIGCGKNFLGRETLNTKEKVHKWMRSLCDELSERLEEDKEANKRYAKTIHVSIRLDNDVGGFSKQCPLPSYIPERICSLALSLIQHTNTTNDHRWIPVIKNISLSAGKFEDSTGGGSGNIKDMFKKVASLASTQTQRKNLIQSSQFGEDLNSSISSTMEQKRGHNSKMGPLQSMLERQLFLQQSFNESQLESVNDYGNEDMKTELFSENNNKTKDSLENPTKEENPKSSKSFFKQFMMRKQLQQNTNTSNEIVDDVEPNNGKTEDDVGENNEEQCDEIDGEESEDELDLLVSHLEDESESDESSSDAAYDAPTDIDSSFSSNRTNSQHNDSNNKINIHQAGTANNSQPRCHSQDLLENDIDSLSEMQKLSENKTLDLESNYLEKGKDLVLISTNKHVIHNSQPGSSSQDFFSDESNDVQVQNDKSVCPESTSYLKEKQNIEINCFGENSNTQDQSDKHNQLLKRRVHNDVQLVSNSENKCMTNSSNKDETLKISVSELFPDLDSVDESILPMLPIELRSEIEKALQKHRTKGHCDNSMKRTGIMKYVSKSPTKHDLDQSINGYEPNSRYDPEASSSVTTAVVNIQGYALKKPDKTINDPSSMDCNSEANLIEMHKESKCPEDMVLCNECGSQVWVFDFPEHQDYHLAQKIQKDFRKQPLINSPSANVGNSPLNKSGLGSKGKKRSSQTKGQSVKHQKLDGFFKPK